MCCRYAAVHLLSGLNACWDRLRESDGVVTSDDELLAVDAGVSLGALQQSDPVVHLLGRVGVTVQHAVRRDHDEGVRPAAGLEIRLETAEEERDHTS